jgi:hypothetical protein
MEKTEDLTNINITNHGDHDLTEELESLYCRVARLDQPDVPVEKGDEHAGKQDFKDLQGRAAPYQNPPNQEELTEKLMAIQRAYERLLTFWPFAREDSPQPPSREAPPEISMRNAPLDGK